MEWCYNFTAAASSSCEGTGCCGPGVLWLMLGMLLLRHSFFFQPPSLPSLIPRHSKNSECLRTRQPPFCAILGTNVYPSSLFVPSPLHPFILPFLYFLFQFSSLSFSLEPVSTSPAHRHEVTYMTTHKAPSLAAIFSYDGTSEFLKLQVSVLVHFSLLRSTCCSASDD